MRLLLPLQGERERSSYLRFHSKRRASAATETRRLRITAGTTGGGGGGDLRASADGSHNEVCIHMLEGATRKGIQDHRTVTTDFVESPYLRYEVVATCVLGTCYNVRAST